MSPDDAPAAPPQEAADQEEPAMVLVGEDAPADEDVSITEE